MTQEPLLEPLLRSLRLRKVKPHIPRNAVLLDVGCGTAVSFLKAISPHVQRCYGVDFKVANLEFDNISTQQLTLSDQLPYPDNQFDTVTLLAVLEHIEQEQAILSEIYRVLVPGGKLVLTVPSVWAKPVLELLAFKLGIISRAEIADHKRYYRRHSLETALTRKQPFRNFYHRYFQFGMNNFCVVEKCVVEK